MNSSLKSTAGNGTVSQELGFLYLCTPPQVPDRFWILAERGHSPLSEAPACPVLYSLLCPRGLHSLTARCNNPPTPCSGIEILIFPAFTP